MFKRTNDTELKVIQKLREKGLLLDRYQYIWETILPSRLQRLADVVSKRTRFISVLLEAVDDGHNQSAVLRSAEAFGIQDVTVIKGNQGFQPNRKITQSAHAWLDIRRADELTSTIEQFKQKGYRIVASHLQHSSKRLEDISFAEPTVLLFGNEHRGLSDQALDLADETFIIPMNGFVQSLNIAVAAAITMHYATERAKRDAKDRYFLSKHEQQELFYRWMLKSARPLVQQLAKKRGDEHFHDCD